MQTTRIVDFPRANSRITLWGGGGFYYIDIFRWEILPWRNHSPFPGRKTTRGEGVAGRGRGATL